MLYIVYIIQSEEGRHYIGYTNNLVIRLEQHNSAKSKWTSRYKNWKVIHKEEFNNKSDALKREKFLKKLKTGDVFKKIINNDAG